MQPREDALIWLDMEMTGLHPDRDYIIEIATIVTDNQLNVIAEGPAIAIHQPAEVLALMDEWNCQTHGASGLIERVQLSSFDTAAAEQLTLDFLTQYVAPGKSPMCGNSICQDRRFMFKHMPMLERFFHYRNLDVSTVKELAKRWYPDVAVNFEKDTKHEALSDVMDSIEECRFYRKHLFVEKLAIPSS